MITISLCMIVKNEAAVLARCLDSIADLVDEIILVDTGSTDRTKAIAAAYTDKIYDFPWNGDFSDARNFSFSKASMDYIYTADADEYLDSVNRERFRLLKQAMLPEVEIVQMKYVTKNEFNTVLNYRDEYRPKLVRRLRTFRWIDPIHETLCLKPVVFDSDIEVTHLPQGLHSKRDFQGLLDAFLRQGGLSPRLHRMYAKELLMTGEREDFEAAFPVFLHTLETVCDTDMQKEAFCVLARGYRLTGHTDDFFKYVIKDISLNPCSESCFELGEYYFEKKDYTEASVWFYNAAYETEPVLNIRFHGDFPLLRLADCYEKLADLSTDSRKREEYLQTASQYHTLANKWELPSDIADAQT